MERNAASMYEARRQLIAGESNVDDVSVTMTTAAAACSIASTFASLSSTTPVYTRPGQYFITAFYPSSVDPEVILLIGPF